jgi:hypothetical protein
MRARQAHCGLASVAAMYAMGWYRGTCTLCGKLALITLRAAAAATVLTAAGIELVESRTAPQPVPSLCVLHQSPHHLACAAGYHRAGGGDCHLHPLHHLLPGLQVAPEREPLGQRPSDGNDKLGQPPPDGGVRQPCLEATPDSVGAPCLTPRGSSQLPTPTLAALSADPAAGDRARAPAGPPPPAQHGTARHGTAHHSTARHGRASSSAGRGLL